MLKHRIHFACGIEEIALVAAAAAGVGGTAYSIANAPKAPNIPPPPGAAIVDPSGRASAAAAKQRQAAAGGLNSTVTGAGAGGAAPASGGPTSGSKQLSGQ